MGLPYEPSGGGYEDDSTAADTDRFADDLPPGGYDGYSHDAASSGTYQDDAEYGLDEDDGDEDDFGEGGSGGQAGWDPGSGLAGGAGRM
jgi:hypothetical protein